MSAARSLGVSGPRLLRRFVMRNALSPMITLLAVQTGYFLFAAVIVETTFNLPGLGQGLVSAVDNEDFPLVQGYTLVFAVAIVLIYLLERHRGLDAGPTGRGRGMSIVRSGRARHRGAGAAGGETTSCRGS